jgi:large subunit ribosomal protein L4
VAAAVLSRTSPEENFTQKVNRKMYRAGLAAILSQLAREDVWRWSKLCHRSAEDQAVLRRSSRPWVLDSVLVITDNLDENLYLSSRNLPNVLVLEAQQADPVSLVRFPKVLVTKGAVAKIEEMLA